MKRTILSCTCLLIAAAIALLQLKIPDLPTEVRLIGWATAGTWIILGLAIEGLRPERKQP